MMQHKCYRFLKVIFLIRIHDINKIYLIVIRPRKKILVFRPRAHHFWVLHKEIFSISFRTALFKLHIIYLFREC